MPDEEKQTEWWGTLQGKITAITGTIGAIGALVAAINSLISTTGLNGLWKIKGNVKLPTTSEAAIKCKQLPSPNLLKVGTTFQDNACFPEMVLLANGKAISKYEVSRDEYSAYMSTPRKEHSMTGAGGCYTPKVIGTNVAFETYPETNWKNPGFTQTSDEPVVCVTGNNAKSYADWLSTVSGKRYEIPSEEDMLYAASPVKSTNVFWATNENVCQYANINDKQGKEVNQFPWDFAKCNDGFPTRTPSGRVISQTAGKLVSYQNYKPNKYGIYNLIGNVYEWLSTPCLTAGQTWIWGGSWTSAPDKAIVARSWCQSKEYKAVDIGIRVIRMP